MQRDILILIINLLVLSSSLVLSWQVASALNLPYFSILTLVLFLTPHIIFLKVLLQFSKVPFIDQIESVTYHFEKFS